MITVFNRESVYIGFDLQEFNRIREILVANQIDYAQKVNNHAGSWALEGTSRGRTGSFGQNKDYQYEYEVYVHKEDYKKAKYLIRK